jgi:hypothetical protein
MLYCYYVILLLCYTAAWHCDFPWYESDIPIPGLNMGLSWVLALEENTILHVLDRHGVEQVIQIPVGHILLFSGDLFHAGPAYPQGDNKRVHGYFATDDNDMRVLNTHWMTEEILAQIKEKARLQHEEEENARLQQEEEEEA